MQPRVARPIHLRFDWKTSFDAGGLPYQIDRDSVRYRAELNRASQPAA